jgi:hypothetical protein
MLCMSLIKNDNAHPEMDDENDDADSPPRHHAIKPGSYESHLPRAAPPTVAMGNLIAPHTPFARAVMAGQDNKNETPISYLSVLLRDSAISATTTTAAATPVPASDSVRRCLSSRELKTLAPSAGSPYANLLSRKEYLEASHRQRLLALRQDEGNNTTTRIRPQSSTDVFDKEEREESRPNVSGPPPRRNQRRSAHNQAGTTSWQKETLEPLVLTLLHFGWNKPSLAVDDLCDVVTDLLIAESKLLNPSLYGVSAHHQLDAASSDSRTGVLNTVKTFVSALPTRYSLGADTPSLVLLHMRLMAVPRADPTKAAVHIQNLDHDPHWRDSDSDHGPGGGAPSTRSVRLVTVACSDRSGLLEFLTRHLSRQKSRVLDADVMTSRDGIALVRPCLFPV